MKIILGSTNQSKKNSISIALESLGIYDYEIECIAVPSNVSSKPLNDDTLKGARNRNRNLLEYLYKNSINFDFVISIEGGYEKIDERYFIVTYASILDHNVCEYLGKSIGLEITPTMFEWVKNGNSLNKVIESIVEDENNKKKNGISGYLTNGLYKRDLFDSSAVQSAFIKMNNSEIYKNLDREIKKLIKC